MSEPVAAAAAAPKKGLDLQLARRLLELVAPYRARLWVTVAMLPAMTAVALAPPYLVKLAIDRHIAPRRVEGLALIAALYGLLLAADAVLRFVHEVLMQWVGQRATTDLRARVYASLMAQDQAWFDRRPTGRLVTRVTSDVEALEEMLGAGVVAIAGDLLMLAGIVAMLLWLDWRLALATFAALPFLWLVVRVVQPVARDAFREIRARFAKMNGFLAERIAVGSSRVDLQACKLEYSIVSPK